jgi:thiol-disulfide isomerase/thioredoxin
MLKKSARGVSESIKRWRFYSHSSESKTKRSFIISSLKSSLPQILVYKLQLQKKLLVQFRITKGGKPFPVFSFKDLDDNLITNENLKGKIVVVKCWFIHCVACIAEFPEVNKMAMKYKDRKDIVLSV